MPQLNEITKERLTKDLIVQRTDQRHSHETVKMKEKIVTHASHAKLQYYRHNYCLVTMTGVLGCRWHRYQQSTRDNRKVSWLSDLSSCAAVHGDAGNHVPRHLLSFAFFSIFAAFAL